MRCSRASCGHARSTASPVVVLAAGRRLARSAARCWPPRPWSSAVPLHFGAFERCRVSHFLSIPDEVDLYSVTLQQRRDARRQHRRPAVRQRPGEPVACLRCQRHAAGPRQPARGRPAPDLPGGDRRHLLHRRQQRPQQQLQSDGRDSGVPGGTTGLYTLDVSSRPTTPLHAGLDRQLVPDGRGHGRGRRHDPGQLHRREPRRRRPRQLSGPGAACRQQCLRQFVAGAGDVHEGRAGGGRDGPRLLVAGRLQRDGAGRPAVGAGGHRPAHRGGPSRARGRPVRQERRPSRRRTGSRSRSSPAFPRARPTCRRSTPVCTRKSPARWARTRSSTWSFTVRAPWATAS